MNQNIFQSIELFFTSHKQAKSHWKISFDICTFCIHNKRFSKDHFAVFRRSFQLHCILHAIYFGQFTGLDSTPKISKIHLINFSKVQRKLFGLFDGKSIYFREFSGLNWVWSVNKLCKQLMCVTKCNIAKCQYFVINWDICGYLNCPQTSRKLRFVFAAAT